MTWHKLHKTNKKLIELYMTYLNHETTTIAYDARLKLVTEIGRLQLQNDWIDGMTVEDYHKDTYDYYIKRTA